MQQLQAVLLHLVVPVAKMLKVAVKMLKAVVKMLKEVIKKLPMEKVQQEKVAKKEEKKAMKHRWKVRLVIRIKNLTDLFLIFRCS